MEPLSCIEEAWFALFFTRYWRQWVISSESHNLEQNFISLNSYVCIELNAHVLILLLMILRSNSSAEECYYFPWLLGSQPCEKAFRAARSMTPTFSTIINFNILGLLRRLHKLQIQIELESQSSSSGIVYPQQSNQRGDVNNGHSVKGITNFEIENAVKSALERAKKCMEELGMKDLLLSTENWDKVSFGDVDDVEDNEGEDALDESIECDKSKTDSSRESKIPEESELNAQECKEVVSSLDLMEKKKVIDDGLKQKITYLCRKESDRNEESTIPVYNVVNQDNVVSTDKKHKQAKKDNRFLEVFYNGEVIYIRKSTLVWILQEGERVSGDRLFRVRVKQPYSSTKQLIPSKLAESTTQQVQECVNIGDFCVFLDSLVNKWNIGRVDQFSKYKEKLKQFKDSKAPILNSSNIGALCTWFTCSTDRRSTFVYSNTKAIDYIPISKSYVCTLPAGCFSQVSSEGSAIVRHSMIGSQLSAKLHTASTLTVNDDAISFINKCIISDKKENEVINLCDNDDETKKTELKKYQCGLQIQEAN